jgi:hypothetical protein
VGDGLLHLTILLKGAIGILLGDIRYRAGEAEKSHDFSTGSKTVKQGEVHNMRILTFSSMILALAFG